MATAAILIFTLNGLVKHHPKITTFYVLMWLWQTFKVLYILIYMIALRTHYFIDFPSGFCFGILFAIIGEKLSYLIDVLVWGKPSTERNLLFHEPCPKCGWAN